MYQLAEATVAAAVVEQELLGLMVRIVGHPVQVAQVRHRLLQAALSRMPAAAAVETRFRVETAALADQEVAGQAQCLAVPALERQEQLIWAVVAAAERQTQAVHLEAQAELAAPVSSF